MPLDFTVGNKSNLNVICSECGHSMSIPIMEIRNVKACEKCGDTNVGVTASDSFKKLTGKSTSDPRRQQPL